MMINSEFLEKKLDEMFKKPKCELDYFDHFSLLISIILSAQTTDKKVNFVIVELFEKYGTPKKLKNAPFSDVKNIIHKLGLSATKAKNIIETATIINNDYNNKVPLEFEKLLAMPGVGNKTAKVFLVETIKANYFPVDTHVARLAKRFNIVGESDSVFKVEKKLEKHFDYKNLARRHQQFVLHGRYICKAKKPDCHKCLLKEECPFYIKNKLS